MKIFEINGFICKLGETAKENWKLLDNANGKYLFFHLSSFPSGYVILECDEIPDNLSLVRAAQICKEGTKYRNLRNIKIDYCQCNNLQKGTEIGIVLFKNKKKVKQISL